MYTSGYSDYKSPSLGSQWLTAQEIKQKDCEYFYNLGYERFSSNGYKAASECLEECLLIGSISQMKQLEVHSLLGQCYLKMGDNEKSRHHFGKGIEIESQSSCGFEDHESHLAAGICYYYLQNSERALVCADTVLSNLKPELLGCREMNNELYWKKACWIELGAYQLKLIIAQSAGDKELEREMLRLIDELEDAIDKKPVKDEHERYYLFTKHSKYERAYLNAYSLTSNFQSHQETSKGQKSAARLKIFQDAVSELNESTKSYNPFLSKQKKALIGIADEEDRFSNVKIQEETITEGMHNAIKNEGNR